ncbi:MAG: 50S ribosomal protein L11 methyltransferase [Bacteroidales bacterium]|nr:50S ribosomal protein L11 methyltransferase [Bacteroidales bacterium]
MNYIEVRCVPAHGNHTADLLIARLAEIGFESFVEEADEIQAFIPFDSYTQKIKEELSSDEMKELLSSFIIIEIPDQNWNAVWESAYEPVTIKGLCAVRAPFHEPIPGIIYDIVIEPKMSFGTAHHETTSMMIQYLLELNVEGKSLLDMGSGTAVLAILAGMKNASPIIAIDNDEWAFNNALENVLHNNQGQIEVLFGDSSLLQGKKFDVVLANINRNILLRDIPDYVSCLPVKGLLVMSGFYEEDLPMISQKCADSGLKFVSSKIENRWTSACFILEK